MKKVFLVYHTDAQHSYASRDIIGIASNDVFAIEICIEHSNKYGEEISPEQLYNLRSIKQTQGYTGEGEYQFESVETNKLL